MSSSRESSVSEDFEEEEELINYRFLTEDVQVIELLLYSPDPLVIYAKIDDETGLRIYDPNI